MYAVGLHPRFQGLLLAASETPRTKQSAITVSLGDFNGLACDGQPSPPTTWSDGVVVAKSLSGKFMILHPNDPDIAALTDVLRKNGLFKLRYLDGLPEGALAAISRNGSTATPGTPECKPILDGGFAGIKKYLLRSAHKLTTGGAWLKPLGFDWPSLCRWMYNGDSTSAANLRELFQFGLGFNRRLEPTGNRYIFIADRPIPYDKIDPRSLATFKDALQAVKQPAGTE